MSKAISVSPIDLLLRVSLASVGAGESPPNTNHGPYVRRVLHRTGTAEGAPWCASQVSDWGAIAFGTSWPLPLTASVVELCKAAEARNVLLIPAKTGARQPRVGDLYALWSVSLNRHAHTGLITQCGDPNPLRVFVRDGNTSSPEDTDPATQREGWLVGEKWRVLSADDRLIRWADLLP